MVSNCDECANRNDCEYSQNWKNLAIKTYEFFKDIDRNPETKSYFSFSVKCDYFYPDKDVLNRNCIMESE